MLRHFGRDAVALVAHDDDAMGRELLFVEVFAVEEGAVNGRSPGSEANKSGRGR